MGAIRYITSGRIDKEPSIWEQSIAELRAYDAEIAAEQAARRPTAGAEEGSVRGRGELSGGEGRVEAPGGTHPRAGEPGPEGQPEPPLEDLPRKVMVPSVGKKGSASASGQPGVRPGIAQF